uniref:NADH:flavin oxidoreductase/NADH oxidase N-terminal domain-containing protein n=1 Tax=Physcomitrium patens TaxID=3218 RepID=A0A2K1IV74_PHYPA|nr:hypothetical protein PHYPA_025122 [Physcomitrium patens]
MPATTTEHEEENPLFWPVQVGNMTVNHRVVLAPMTRCRAIGGVPQESLVKHYAQRASLGGLLISEANAVSPEAYGLQSLLYLTYNINTGSDVFANTGTIKRVFKMVDQ